MKIQSLTAFHVPIALKRPVRHASHVRYSNDTLIVRCELSDGSVGWGEGLPRPYVTGETIETVQQHLEQTAFSALTESVRNAREISDLFDQFKLADVSAPENIVTRECFGNAVRCALEVAILDAACRSEQQTLGDFISSLPEASGIVRHQQTVFYSGVITSEKPLKQIRSAIQMRVFGFRQIKVKVGTDGIDDARLLRRIRRFTGQNIDLRLDANEAWHADDVARKMEPLMQFSPTSLEQPVPHAEVGGLAAVREKLSVPVMLDESLCSEEDGERALQAGTCDLFNIRLSKCGGIRNSVRLAAMAKAGGLGYQLGSQVGETGILSAAGRHFACNIDDIRYLEGSFDRFLVRETLTEENLTFSRMGRAPRLNSPGLGITVNEDRVRAIAKHRLDLI